jgi:hypothetical protein
MYNPARQELADKRQAGDDSERSKAISMIIKDVPFLDESYRRMP